jgi:hypothetical protein
LRVTTSPVPTLTQTRVYLVRIQATTGGVASGGVSGVKVAAVFYRA